MEIQLSLSPNADGLTVTLSGELDSLSAPKLYDQLSQAIKDHPNIKKISFECRNLSYISSAGAGILLLSLDNFGHRGIDFELRNVRPEVYNILDLLGLTKVMSVSNG
jgi:anti-sigma B factor antagonist